MARILDTLQTTAKNSTSCMFLLSFRWLSAGLFGLVIANIAQAIIGFSVFGFIFFFVVFMSLFIRLTKSYEWRGLIMTDLLLILVGFLLRMYILIAPNM